jgi:hypothetical protein
MYVYNLPSKDNQGDEDEQPTSFVILPVLGDVVALDQIAVVGAGLFGSGEGSAPFHIRGGAAFLSMCHIPGLPSKPEH